jgi:F0F1-type ATP synthase membrane subunit b/b'
MADYRNTHKVSRHTMVMRRARDDDARRVSEREDDGVALPIPSSMVGSSCSLTARGAVPHSDHSESGRTVEVRESGRASARLTGRQATSIRLAAGDTIVRYKSGDMVIKRGARRSTLRRQILTVYAVGYLAIFGLFVYWLLTGAVAMTPEQYLESAFARRQGEGIMDLERAAMEAMRGNRTPAEIRLAQNLDFFDENRNTVTVEKGNRLTLLKAAQFGHAIIEDLKREPARREFQGAIAVYKESHLANVNWPHLMTVYNAIGFFLLVGLFLYRPVVHYLGTQGKKTAVALKNARSAAETAADYRDRYRDLADDIEEKGRELRADAADRIEQERGAALKRAGRQAEEIAGGVAGALNRDVLRHAGDIGRTAATAACEQARDMLRERLGPAEHDAAIEELIAGIAGLAPKTA